MRYLQISQFMRNGLMDQCRGLVSSDIPFISGSVIGQSLAVPGRRDNAVNEHLNNETRRN